MKRIIRTDAKRLLSVFLATLLLLTAWVFVVPEHAGAVTSSGTYTYRVYINCTNAYTGKNGYYQVKGKPNNGTGTEADIYKGTSGSLGCGSGSIFDKGNSAYYPSSSGATASSFPTYFYVYTYKDSGPESTGKTDGAFSAELQLYVNGSWTTVASGSSGTQSGHTAIAAGGSTGSSHYPKLNTVTIDESPSNVTIPTSGTATTNFKAHATDQYGVRIASAATGYTSSATITSNTGVTIPKQTTTNASDYWKPSVTNDAKMAGNTNEKELSVYATFAFNGVSKNTDTKKFKIIDPQYNYLFDENGGAKLLYDNNGVATEVAKVNIGDDVYKYGYKTYYGNSASDAGAKIPTDGNRVGHEFIAMYGSKKVISYAATKPEAGTTSGYTGQLKSSDEMNYTGKTYYAAWWAKDVNVTYINNDGTVLKTSAAGKYDQKADYTTASAAPANPEYVYAPGASHGTYEYEFDHWEVVQAKQYNNASNNNQSDYSELVGVAYNNAVLKGDTTFQAIYRIKGSTPTKYTITYKNGTETTSNANFIYKADGYKTATYPATTDESKTYTYTFLGWAEQVNSNDTVYFQDWDADAGAYIPQNNAQTPLTDYKVYSSKTWVAVYGRKYIDYTVTFNFVGVTTDETGATVYDSSNQIVYTKHYNDTIEIPVPDPENGTGALPYTGGKLSGTAPTGVTYSNAIGNTYNFSAWNPAQNGTTVDIKDLTDWTSSNDNLKTKTFTATYAATPANYTIKFLDYDGTVLNEGNTSFDHGTPVSSAKQTADANVTQTWRDDDNEYTFTGWAPAYAGSATDNVTYIAQYTPAALYTITYADESGVLATWKGTTAENIPYMPAGIDAAPTKENDAYAKDYRFSGWATTPYDAKNPVTPAITETRNVTVPEGGTTVYAQFTRTPIIYTINFVYGNPDANGKMPDHKQNLEYGEAVAIPTGNTLKRDSDNTYNYEFSGWDITPSSTVNNQIAFVQPDENNNLTNPTATFTANYRKSYVYYDVTWLYQNGVKVNDKHFRVEKYIFDGRIREPFSTPEALKDNNGEFILNGLLVLDEDNKLVTVTQQPDDGFTYGFNKWILAKQEGNNWVPQLDAEENVILFNNNTHIAVGVTYAYLPTYELVADLKTLTILDEDGTELGTRQIGLNKTILDEVETPAAKSSNEDNHYVFAKWVYVSDDASVNGTKVLATDTMTDDTTIKAVYEAKPHKYGSFEEKTAPTFDAAGEVTLVCGADGCGWKKDVEIPALRDTVLPKVRLYVKNQSWMSTDPSELTALDGTVLPIAPNCQLIANTSDKAEESTYYIDKSTCEVKTELDENDAAVDYIEVTYNTALTGSQVNKIWAYYTDADHPLDLDALKAVANATESNPDGWHLLYDRNEVGGEANHSDVFASFEPAIEDGHTYIVYLKAIDAKDNVNYVSSAKLGYDTTAPVVTLTSENGSNAKPAAEGTEAVEGTKFCLDTTITVAEADLTITLDGRAITMTGNTYEVTAAGKHTVRVTDPAGNVTAKAFEIVGQHKWATSYKAATCTEDGWQKEICLLCGKENGEGQTFHAEGHVTENAHHDAVAATCAKTGKIEYWSCSRCGKLFDDAAMTHEINKNDLSTPKTNEHNWKLQITKDANCKDNGTALFTCERCKVTETVEGDTLDAEATGYVGETAATAILAAHPDLVDETTGAIIIVHDGVNHSWKAPKQTTAPTCTTLGEITKTCRYCGKSEHVSDVDMVPHVGTGEWTYDPAPTCTAGGFKYQTHCENCETEGLVLNKEAVDALGHDKYVAANVPPKQNEQGTWVEGHITYKCHRCDWEETETIPVPVQYTYTFKVDDETVGTPITKAPGQTITAEEVPTATKAADKYKKYTFAAWVDGEGNEVTFPLVVTNALGDQTFTATFTEEDVLYTITFFMEDGTTKYGETGLKKFGDTFVRVGPEKEADAQFVYTFIGWTALDTVVPANPAENDAYLVNEITVAGDASYKAVYSKSARTYQVIWEIDGEVAKVETAEGGKTLQELLDAHADGAATKNPTKAYDDNYHYTFKEWNYALSTIVSGNLTVIAKWNKAKHHNVKSADSKLPTCTEPGKDVYKCNDCGYSYDVANGKALGHDFSVQLEYVAPTKEQDGYKVMKCSRCDETQRTELSYYAIKLEITVKNTDHEVVQGAKVSVYDGNEFIGSAITDVNGVAVVYVPEAKEYTIVIEGAEFTKVTGTITVDENGNITGGAVPTPKAASTCTCTCHKKGLWPTIFRFYHKLIKILTGKYHCCGDAHY